MKKRIKITMLLTISITLIITVLGLSNKLNETVVLIVSLICVIVVFITFEGWQRRSNKLGIRKTFELKSKGKVNNKITRKIIKAISSVIMAGAFYIIFNSQINNFYIFIYVVVHIILNIVFLTPRKIVLDSNAINYFPNWKVKWMKLKDYQLDKNKGVLMLEKIDGQRIHIKEIKKEDFDNLEKMIIKYNNK